MISMAIAPKTAPRIPQRMVVARRIWDERKKGTVQFIRQINQRGQRQNIRAMDQEMDRMVDWFARRKKGQ
jgi:hypothetical protein